MKTPFLVAFFAAVAEVGRYRQGLADARKAGSHSVRFTPFIPNTSQKKRRLMARRLGRQEGAMAIRIVPINEFGVLCVVEHYELIDFVRYGRSPFAVLAKRDESAEVIRG